MVQRAKKGVRGQLEQIFTLPSSNPPVPPVSACPSALCGRLGLNDPNTVCTHSRPPFPSTLLDYMKWCRCAAIYIRAAALVQCGAAPSSLA